MFRPQFTGQEIWFFAYIPNTPILLPNNMSGDDAYRRAHQKLELGRKVNAHQGKHHEETRWTRHAIPAGQSVW
jgi:hypothetical protein